ncbi:MAG: hypothetical protein IPN77_31640 [Sandaracinaceae bacterium]|nr:hypothetical protein [Sandaracinaceae bacterium]
MTEMMEGFERLGSGIEVNIGNLPYCVLPEFARIIEHGGEFTWTISGDGGASLRDPLDKYSYQRQAHGYCRRAQAASHAPLQGPARRRPRHARSAETSR